MTPGQEARKNVWELIEQYADMYNDRSAQSFIHHLSEELDRALKALESAAYDAAGWQRAEVRIADAVSPRGGTGGPTIELTYAYYGDHLPSGTKAQHRTYGPGDVFFVAGAFVFGVALAAVAAGKKQAETGHHDAGGPHDADR